ncbi:hypothetical protein NQ314_009224 [Rhamnusium bicolor]|uniref:Tyr recombinase domain-containing protein n=1 Tax=Rhamnusium bicolor TaxID=1586634 RepID=A0AAV8Y267_9CUCU|nr:hypothetical protein NQ314_009224 [Rhamnusium bicolor]
MLKARTNLVSKDNPYLFAQIKKSLKWINGSNVLKKIAFDCGAQHPESLTSSRLRKQIATVLQILNLSEIEMEQIATFMGHTRKTHEKFYRYVSIYLKICSHIIFSGCDKLKIF